MTTDHSARVPAVDGGFAALGLSPTLCQVVAELGFATPGRALDHITRGSLNLNRVATIVVDEADRMLDMGFGAEMEKILTTAPKPRQTILFSATYPRGAASSSIDAMTETHQLNPE